MPRSLHFFRRNDALFWRRRLPRRVAEIYGRTHVCRSLKTSVRRQARRRALQLSIGFETIMEQAEQAIAAGRPPTKADLEQALVELFNRIRWECEQWLALRPPFLHDRRYASEEEFIADVDRIFDDYHDPHYRRAQWQHWVKNGVYGEAADRLAEILAGMGISVDSDSMELKMLASRGMRIGIEAFSQFLRSYNDHELDDDLKALIQRRLEPAPPAAGFQLQQPQAHRAPPIQVTKAEAPRLSSFKKAFVEQAVREGRWTEQTKAQNSNSIDLLVRIVGDKPINEIGNADAKKLRRTLEKIPQNYGKSPEHYKLPIEQVIAKHKKDARTLSRGTLDRHWSTIVSYVKWMNRQDEVEPLNIDRIFGGFRWAVEVPKSEKRIEWDDKSIEMLFKSPIWTGCMPDSKRRYWRHRPGPYIVADEFWWLPLLGIYHGGREDEYCQLTGKNIYEVEGIWVMDFHGLRLKTKSSERIVPIHSAMIELGFLELVERSKGRRIFPSMKTGGRDETYSHVYTKQFSDYRKRVGVYRERMDFHSFRKNVTNRMIRAGASILQADEITGHDSRARKEVKEAQSVTLDYWDGFELPQRRDVVETIRYPTIDLARLQGDLAQARPYRWK